MINTEEFLKENNYDFYSYTEEGIKPEIVNLRFIDIIPELEGLEISNKYLYLHQYNAYNELCKGKNLILKSGTGSGKTEGWLIFSLKNKLKTLVVYPTLALAYDQLKRIEKYSSKLKINSLAIDSLKKRELLKEYGKDLRSIINSQDIIITNPAFLLQEVKNILVKNKSLLLSFIKKVKLFVIDEIDFYSPREIALILALLNILKDIIEEDFQIVILTAMLENPEDLANILSNLSKKETSIITGKPFRVENRTIIVLGKDLKKIWEKIKENEKNIKNLGDDIKKALKDFEYFKNNSYKIIEALKAININIDLQFDIADLIKEYCYDDCLTLVFTKGINKADELAKKIQDRLPEDKKVRVASHHHLISKESRKAIEEGARSGKIKVLISPRTLSQGIDIGSIARIIHVGLPESLREFYQREGRKGRREEIPFSETIIIPYGRWDKSLLMRGVESLKAWLKMPVEKVIVNPDNNYRKLFENLFKFISPYFKNKLSKEDYEFLYKLGLVKGNELTAKGEEVKRNLNFYEYGPPYGINRVIRYRDHEIYLEEISHCDLVEKFQIGCFDYSQDGIVVEHKLGGSTGRVVSKVILEKINFYNLIKRDEFAKAIEEYEEIKIKWGENVDFYEDFVKGKIHSEVLCVVYPPRKGFDKYLKIPNRVTWRLKSFKPKVITIGNRTVVYYDSKVIEIPTATYGKYSDFTYGASYELDSLEDTTKIRIGLAYLMIILRKKFQIPFETILYDVIKLGEKKFFGLHEPNSAGLIDKLDWLEIKKAVENYQPEELDEVLFEAIDEYAYSDFINYKFDWNLAKTYAIKVLDYILLEQKINVKFKDLNVYIPKPSRALKLLSLDFLLIPLNEDKHISLFSLFDGENKITEIIYKEYNKIERTGNIIELLGEYINEDFNFITFDLNLFEKQVNENGLKALSILINSLKNENKFIDVKKQYESLLNISNLTLEELEKIANFERKVNFGIVLKEASLSIQRISQLKTAGWKNYTKYLIEKAKQYCEDNVEATYKLYLIYNEINKKKIKEVVTQ